MDELSLAVERAPPPASLEEVRAWFISEGIVVSEWASCNGFEAAHVYAVLSGRVRGRRGSAHRIAVALGLKGAPSKRWTPTGNDASPSLQACA